MSNALKYLTKSAFAQAVPCHTKLHYFANNYPSANSDNEYLKFLAQGGFMVGALAQIMHPDGILASKTGDPIADSADTKQKLLASDITLFEASIVEGRKLAIADILHKSGNKLKLIEVKSKSIDTSKDSPSEIFRTKKGEIRAEWSKYLYDITFQYSLFSKSFPNLNVTPYLLLVDKSNRCQIDALPSYFSLHVDKDGNNPTVSIRPGAAQKLQSVNLLTLVDVSSEVKDLLPLIQTEIQLLEESLTTGKKIPARLSTKCKECEFQGNNLSPHGYDECWKGFTKVKDHIFDLSYGGLLKTDGELLLDKLIDQKQISLFDIPREALTGKRGVRQLVQIECTDKNEEWIDPELKKFIKDVKYPLHFIDFETTRTALPFHANMRPFEQIAFQWSCHTVESPGAEPIHSEWINDEAKFPNFAFARSLMETTSTGGTILVWAHHEGSVLTDILNQMETYGHRDDELKTFLEEMVAIKSSQGRFVDMNKLTSEYYFHPEMKGKTSIKKVFPAIWKANPHLRKLPWFAPYEVFADGKVMDPYKNLPPIVIAGCDVSVQEGTAAMRAYEEMIFGKASRAPEEKMKWRSLLLQYCKLDTWAMWVIWGRWGN